ncbi:hypothetical protein FACS1894188_00580 [Clostridia bacterium]|nr:hypothetical protein FACS1894188_00580 [Clostridia bacterium]
MKISERTDVMTDHQYNSTVLSTYYSTKLLAEAMITDKAQLDPFLERLRALCFNLTGSDPEKPIYGN